MKKLKKNKGITLIALVITIIILLILAGISISTLTNTGLFKKVEEAKQKSESKQAEENETLEEHERIIGEYIDENGGGSGTEGSGTGGSTGDGTEDTPLPNPLVQYVNKVLSTTQNTPLTDEYGNQIVVPPEFKIVVDSTTGYNADTINVTKGIVIEDGTGNQFVWVPVGDVYTTTDTEKTTSNTKTITLSRYSFDISNGTPTAKSGSDAINTYYTETDSNSVAKDIVAFKTSAVNNHGYYFGRYEAGKEGTDTIVCKKEATVWTTITRNTALSIAQGMYTSKPYTSDLINSFAWDTAIVFIQNFGTNSNYANKGSVNTSLTTTGNAGDVQCNINDMASNSFEWSTEYSSHYSHPCVYRGGCYYYSGSTYPRNRQYNSTSYSYFYIGFRPLLYL